jgi:hypothetical protein
VIFAGQHVQRLLARHQVGDGIGLAMNDNQRSTTQRITDLEGAAQKARLEAIQIAAKIISKENALLAGTAAKPNRNDELAALRTRYAVLVKTADEAQALIDKLQADDHDTKYHR